METPLSLNTYPLGATTAYLASAADYPDALAGAPVAGLAGAPLLLRACDELTQLVSGVSGPGVRL